MPAIYPSTALKNEQRAIKAIADREVVYITENGRGKYLFMSQEVHDREVAEAVEEALSLVTFWDEEVDAIDPPVFAAAMT